jgi:hypothetical protein
MGMGMISKLMVYERLGVGGSIKKVSVKILLQLIARHVYTCDLHRKKIPVGGGETSH